MNCRSLAPPGGSPQLGTHEPAKALRFQRCHEVRPTARSTQAWHMRACAAGCSFARVLRLSGVPMKVVAISVGKPREVQWRGRSVQTSIYKTPVSDRVRVTRDNIEGDQQSDLSVHGGPEKAVYAYPAEHYQYWRRELPDAELAWGAFGENFTTEGILEDDVWIRDRERVGNAELVHP